MRDPEAPCARLPWELPRAPASSPGAGSLPFSGASSFIFSSLCRKDFIVSFLSLVFVRGEKPSHGEHRSELRVGEPRTTRTGYN